MTQTLTARAAVCIAPSPRSLPQVVEAPGAARCIGPGCSSVAQPDSVYCSNSCILKHAAATMRFLSSGKDQRPKPKEKMKVKAEKLRLPTWSVQVSRPAAGGGAGLPRHCPAWGRGPGLPWSCGMLGSIQGSLETDAALEPVSALLRSRV